MELKETYQITYKALCFTVEVMDLPQFLMKQVTFAAPCAHWMVGKDWHSCKQYWERRGATITFVK